MHSLGAGVHKARLHFHDVAYQQRPVETHPAGKYRHGVFAAIPGRANIGGLVDPLHDDAAVHLAAPVHIRRGGHEPKDHPFRRAGVRVLLRIHGLDDVLADLDPRQGVVALLGLLRSGRFELRDGDRFTVRAHGHKYHHALAAHCGRPAFGIARGHHRADMHG
ncbi:hypothetical protein D9M69_623690 [compost metagenome]